MIAFDIHRIGAGTILRREEATAFARAGASFLDGFPTSSEGGAP